jgi:hypothetical protein
MEGNSMTNLAVTGGVPSLSDHPGMTNTGMTEIHGHH